MDKKRAEIGFLTLDMGGESLANLKLPDPYLLDYYTWESKRVLFIEGEINQDLNEVGKKILLWNLEDGQKAGQPRKPIYLMINSIGGLLEAALSLADIIEASETPVIGVNLGEACSAAALIFCACHDTYMMKHSYFLIHQGSGGAGGTYGQAVSAVKNYTQRVKCMEDIIFNKLDIPKKEFENNMREEWYLYPEDAQKINLCNKVINNVSEIFGEV